MSAATPGAQGERPALRIISGSATPEEIAAIVAVLAATGSGPEVAGASGRVSRWAAPATRLRSDLGRGWRASALPR